MKCLKCGAALTGTRCGSCGFDLRRDSFTTLLPPDSPAVRKLEDYVLGIIKQEEDEKREKERRETDELKRKLERLRSETDDLRAKNENLEVRNSQLRDENDKLFKDLIYTEKQDETIKDLEDKNRRLNEKLKTAQQEKQDANVRADRERSARQDLERENRKLKNSTPAPAPVSRPSAPIRKSSASASKPAGAKTAAATKKISSTRLLLLMLLMHLPVVVSYVATFLLRPFVHREYLLFDVYILGPAFILFFALLPKKKDLISLDAVFSLGFLFAVVAKVSVVMKYISDLNSTELSMVDNISPFYCIIGLSLVPLLFCLVTYILMYNTSLISSVSRILDALNILVLIVCVVGSGVYYFCELDKFETFKQRYPTEFVSEVSADIGIGPDSSTAEVQEVSEKVKRKYYDECEKTLITGMANGSYKQVVITDHLVYCLNKDGTVSVFGDKYDSQLYDYSNWHDVVSLSTTDYSPNVTGLTSDGRVLSFIKETESWSNVKVLRGYLSDIAAVTEDGKVYSTIEQKDFINKIRNCVTAIPISSKDGDSTVIGVSSAGKLIYEPGNLHIGKEIEAAAKEWTDLKDICFSNTGALFGLTNSGKLLYCIRVSEGSEHYDISMQWKEYCGSLTNVTAVGSGWDYNAILIDGRIYGGGVSEAEDWTDIKNIDCWEHNLIGYKKNGAILMTGDFPWNKD
ncbi:MAG: hypothetical protein IKN17_04530 [Ruminococcus sp.]|nr:hypothetical protein [Ruminococcus sp.]